MIKIEDIAKIIAGNYDDWKAYLGRAKKVIEYIKKKEKLCLSNHING